MTVFPDAIPRDAEMEPQITSRGGYANSDGLYFDEAGNPLNRDTGEPLANGTTLAANGFLTTPDGELVGPDGEPMPNVEEVLPENITVTPERRPREVAGMVPIGEQGAQLQSSVLSSS